VRCGWEEAHGIAVRMVLQEFNWTGLWATKQGKIVRSFVPTSFDEYNWEFLKSWKRFVSVLLLCIAVRFPPPLPVSGFLN
jgi:hypothetical protein